MTLYCEASVRRGGYTVHCGITLERLGPDGPVTVAVRDAGGALVGTCHARGASKAMLVMLFGEVSYSWPRVEEPVDAARLKWSKHALSGGESWLSTKVGGLVPQGGPTWQ